VTQSVELLLDPAAEAVVKREWQALHDTGLPSELRSEPAGSHRPHVTLWAGAEIAAVAEGALAVLVADLGLAVELGPLTLFGPARGSYVLVHALVPSMDLLELQSAVAGTCAAEPSSYFAPGRWTPHVTLARRMRPEQLAAALTALAPCSGVGQPIWITRCRRWDSVARRDWLLTELGEAAL